MPDPRSTEGELMCPALYPPERIVKRKRDLASRLCGSVPAAAHKRNRRAFSPCMAAGAGGATGWLPLRSLPLLGSRFDGTVTRYRSRLDSRRARLVLAGWVLLRR